MVCDTTPWEGVQGEGNPGLKWDEKEWEVEVGKDRAGSGRNRKNYATFRNSLQWTQSKGRGGSHQRRKRNWYERAREAGTRFLVNFKRPWSEVGLFLNYLGVFLVVA